MKKLLLFILTILFVTFPTHAQWQKGVLRRLKKAPTQTLTARTLAAQRVQNRILRQSLQDKATALLKSTLILKIDNEEAGSFYHWNFLGASAFVFEEHYKGKSYLWGATASHYNLAEPFLEDAQTGEKLPVQILAKGNSYQNDVALFPIPPQLQNQFKPLQLAAHSPQKGEKLYSAGYFDDGFQVEKNRKVTDILPTRIVTSLVVEDKLAREGACGGPVLNKQKEIVGIHAGSSSKKQTGFIIPVEHIYELLQAYHNNGKSLQPFYFKGRKIGNININESIQYIEVWQGNKKLQDFETYPKRAYLDYEHLENLVDASHADKIVFVIEREPFSMVAKDQNTYQFKITYNLHTFRITESLPKKIQY